MLLKVDRNGGVIQCDGSPEVELFLRGKDEGWIHVNNGIGEEAFVSGEVEFDRPFFSVENDKLTYIALPGAPHYEIYWVQDQRGYYWFGKSFPRVAATLESTSRDIQSIEYFRRKGTFPASRTLLKEVRRLTPGRIYRVKKGVLVHELVGQRQQASVQPGYQEFKERFEESVELYASGRRVGVMLSGGVDSLATAIALSRGGHRPDTFSLAYRPQVKEIADDLDRATQISAHFNWTHHVVEADFTKLSVENLKQYVGWAPMGVHLSLPFDALLGRMKAKGVEVGFSGQNLDNLYNLGPTSRVSLTRSGMASLFRRWFLTEEYAKAVSRGARIGFSTPLLRASGWLGAGIYSISKKRLYRPPRGASELVRQFNSSADAVVFAPWSSSFDPNLEDIDSSEVRSRMLEKKIQEYMMSSDSQILRRAGDKYDVLTVLPFSMEGMMGVWRDIKPGIRDVFAPKRYVHQYIREMFPGYYGLKMPSKQSHVPSYHAWATTLLQSPGIGEELATFQTNRDGERITPAQQLQGALVELWLDELFSILDKAGVKVH